MEPEDNLYNTFNKQLYRQGSPVYKGDGNPLSDLSTVQPSSIGDGFSPGSTEMVEGALQSGKFLTGVRGWRLLPDSAEFQTAIFNIGGTVITIDNTQNIQTNLDLINTAGGGTLYLQNGTYTLTEDILIPSRVTLQGVSRDGVILDCDGTWAVKIVGTNVYSTGTVTINNGDTTVVGSGTTWTAAMIGRFILLDGLWYEITARASNTSITIDAYQGVNLAGSAYVLADTNFTAVIQNLTITGATGSGMVVQYAQECQLNNLYIYGCGTGIEMDYVVYPKIEVTSNENGVNLNMNFVEGFSIDFSDLSYSTTGAGVIMTDTRNATLFNTSVNDNTGDGINATNCDKIAYISFDISGNGGQGVEFVSGCDDNQFTDGVFDGNASDGIKLTATSDRNTLVAVSIKNNGGYGINIAASSCDNNQIIAPAFDNNTSGNINDQGTNTFVSPQEESFPFQEIPISTGTDTITSFTTTSNADGTVLFVATVKSGSTSTINLFRLAREKGSGNYYITNTTTLAFTAGNFGGIAVVGSYLYVSCEIAAAIALRRYDVADLANVTTMTFSGTARRGNCFSDGTDLYIRAGVGTADRFTIVTTTATNAGNIAYTGTMNSVVFGSIANTNYAWFPDDGNTDLTAGASFIINRYAIGGGAVVSSRTMIGFLDVYTGIQSQPAFFIGNSTQLGIAYAFNTISVSAVTGIAVRVFAIRLP